MKKNLRYEIYAELLFLILGVIYLGTAFTIEESSMKLNSTNLPPKFYPIIVGLAWVASVAFVLGSTIAKYKNAEDDGQPAKLKFIPKNVLIAGGAFILYIVGLYVIGFIPSTLIFAIGILTFLEPKNLKTNIIYSVIFTMIVYVVFDRILTIYLPKGMLFG